MSRVPVLHVPPYGKWDQVDLLAMFDEDRFDLDPGQVSGGAVVVVPAGDHEPEQVNDFMAKLDWVLLILTSDERSTFDHRALRHPNMRLWIMTPRPGQHEPGEARYIGEGVGPDTRRILGDVELVRTIDAWFGGQVNHSSRAELVRVLGTMDGRGVASVTPGFLQGLRRDIYLASLTQTRFAPAPAGPGTPDSFRFYEALEAGCVPVVEDRCSGNEIPGYWRLVFGDDLPFPVLTDWEYLPGFVEDLGPSWQSIANRCGAWWQQRRRTERTWLEDDIRALGADLPNRNDITVIVTSSPILSHPSTAIIEETVESVRWHLPDSELIVACDGVRPEQAETTADYEEYQRRLLRLTRRWGALPLFAAEHVHQANLMRRALELVRTPLVLFVEHDTPLVTDCGPIPFDLMGRLIQRGDYNSVRLLHEALVLPDYEHLMVDRSPAWCGMPVDTEVVPLRRTMQWSQRPHLASTAWYRHVMATYFADAGRTFIEDVMHGVVDHAWRTEGRMGWNLWRLAIYEPPGNAKRSLHSDGRAGGAKYDDRLVFAYDGPTPPGAPRATSERG